MFRRVLVSLAGAVLAAVAMLGFTAQAQAAPVQFNGQCETPIFGEVAELCLWGTNPNGLTDYQSADTNHGDDAVFGNPGEGVRCCAANTKTAARNTAPTFCRNGACYPNAGYVCNGVFYQGPCIAVPKGGGDVALTGIFFRENESHYFA